MAAIGRRKLMQIMPVKAFMPSIKNKRMQDTFPVVSCIQQRREKRNLER
ncbi:hypothetical protein CTS44_21742 [Comamonas thiooxydans]|nr:hypothetical protein CTS44_21742 [Comamonas thiooxydans]